MPGSARKLHGVHASLNMHSRNMVSWLPASCGAGLQQSMWLPQGLSSCSSCTREAKHVIMHRVAAPEHHVLPIPQRCSRYTTCGHANACWDPTTYGLKHTWQATPKCQHCLCVACILQLTSELPLAHNACRAKARGQLISVTTTSCTVSRGLALNLGRGSRDVRGSRRMQLQKTRSRSGLARLPPL